MIPLTISTTKRVNTCLIPSLVSWRIQAKKMDQCTSFCSKRACTVSCSGVPFGTQESEMHLVVIYFGMRCVVPETPKPSFAGHARLHEHIAWTLRPFVALDSRLFRGKGIPKKIEKKTNNVETLRRKNGTDLVQNQSIEFEVVRSDRFCCPIALTIAVQNLCAVLLWHLFWRLYAITNHN